MTVLGCFRRFRGVATAAPISLFFLLLLLLGSLTRAGGNRRLQRQQLLQEHELCFEQDDNILSVKEAVWKDLPAGAIAAQATQSSSCPPLLGAHPYHGCCKNEVKRYNIPAHCNGLHELLTRLQNKRMCILGDSLSFNTHQVLIQQLLHSNINVTCSAEWHLCRLPEYNVEIDMKEFWYIMMPNETIDFAHDIPESEKLQVDIFRHLLTNCDSMMINMGMHFGRAHTYDWKKKEWISARGFTVQYLDVMLRLIRQELERDLKTHPEKTHFYRLTYPQHFNTKAAYPNAGDYWLGAYEKSIPLNCVEFAHRHWSDSLAQSLFRDSPIVVLDYYHPLSHSGFYHSVLNVPGHEDCTHYCFHQNLWEPLWGLINYAFKLKELRKIGSKPVRLDK